MQETVGNSWTVLKVILSHKYHHLLGFYLSERLFGQVINGIIAGVGGGILTPRNKLWKEDFLIPVSLPSQSSRPLHLSHVCVPCVSVYGGGRGGERGGGRRGGGGIRYVCGGWGGGRWVRVRCARKTAILWLWSTLDQTVRKVAVAGNTGTSSGSQWWQSAGRESQHWQTWICKYCKYWEKQTNNNNTTTNKQKTANNNF